MVVDDRTIRTTFLESAMWQNYALLKQRMQLCLSEQI